MSLKTSLIRIFTSVIVLIGVVFFAAYLKAESDYYKSLTYKIQATRDIYKRLSLHTGQATVPLNIEYSGVVNAWTNGSSITMTTGFLEFIDNNDEIAGILAHEMAHVMLRHVEPTSPLSTVDKEAVADKMSAYLLLRSGYNVCRANELWIKLREVNSGDYADPYNYDHPSYSYRYHALNMPWCQ